MLIMKILLYMCGLSGGQRAYFMTNRQHIKRLGSERIWDRAWNHPVQFQGTMASRQPFMTEWWEEWSCVYITHLAPGLVGHSISTEHHGCSRWKVRSNSFNSPTIYTQEWYCNCQCSSWLVLCNTVSGRSILQELSCPAMLLEQHRAVCEFELITK